jgi:hypothetical protein
VVDLDATLGQELLEVPVGKPEPQIPADRQDDHLGGNRYPTNADPPRATGGQQRRRVITQVSLPPRPDGSTQQRRGEYSPSTVRDA